MATEPDTLDKLWTDIAPNDINEQAQLLEKFLLLEKRLQNLSTGPISGEDNEPANALYAWIAGHCTPSAEFSEALESAYSADIEKRKPLTESQNRLRSRYATGISCLAALNKIYPFQKVENLQDTLVLLASFSSELDPWTTSPSHEHACSLLESFAQSQASSLWSILGNLLEIKLRPIFSRTKNPAITAAGRKRLHPVPQARFDPSILDAETKPWKFRDVYATTVVEWILLQLNPSNYSQAEEYLPLLVPPILSLIDDDSLPFKARGCKLLSMFSLPLTEVGSDFLKRTNLSSVFEDAVIPCLLSLPTITPEDESLQILGAAYPAILSSLRARYQSASTTPSPDPPNDKTIYIQKITTILRNHILPSFHHISSSIPAATTSSTNPSMISSFPYPRLSTFILQVLSIYIAELGTHTTKYLQDIVPVLYITLTNPFGTAYPPLLEAVISAARSLVLNAYFRVWRFRGELLGGLCSCWLHILEEDTEETSQDPFIRLKRQLQGVTYLLQVSIGRTIEFFAAQKKQKDERQGSPSEIRVVVDWVGLDTEIDIRKECTELVQADESLKDLLFADAKFEELEGKDFELYFGVPGRN